MVLKAMFLDSLVGPHLLITRVGDPQIRIFSENDAVDAEYSIEEQPLWQDSVCYASQRARRLA
jgi:hypothetical protein